MQDGITPGSNDQVSIMGIMVNGIPEGWQPLNVIAVIECLRLDEEQILPGRYPYSLVCRASEGLSLWTAEGMIDWVRRQIIAQSSTED